MTATFGSVLRRSHRVSPWVELHDEVVARAFAADVVGCAEVAMVERGESACLTFEALAGFGPVSSLRPEDWMVRRPESSEFPSEGNCYIYMVYMI